MLFSVNSLNKIENLQKRALRFILSDFESFYDALLWLSGGCAINVRLKRNLCVEMYKILNDLNHSFMREIFETPKTKRAVREKYKISLEIPRVNQASFGTEILRFYGPKNGNSLPYHIKSVENLLCFKMSSKMSPKAKMVHFLVVKTAGSSTLLNDFKYFKKQFIKIMCGLFAIPFGEDSSCTETC